MKSTILVEKSNYTKALQKSTFTRTYERLNEIIFLNSHKITKPGA